MKLLPHSLLILLFAGCATTSAPTAKHEVDPNANISAYQTYGMMPLPNSIPGADPGVVLRLGPVALDAAKQSLVAKGYQEGELSTADFAVAITGKVVPKVEVTDWGYDPFYTYPAVGRWGRAHPYYNAHRDIDVDTYSEGTLIVQVFDRKTQKLVWIGWDVTTRRYGKPTAESVDATVREIMANFPMK